MARPLPDPLVDITPFATDPPHLGGQVAIRSTNAALARLGWPVEQFSLGIRRADLRFIGRPRRLPISPAYRETRRTEPLSMLLFLASAALHVPYWWASRALAWRRWPELQSSVGRARAVMIEMPWCYAPDALVPPLGAPLIYVSQNAEYLLARNLYAGRTPWGPRLAQQVERLEQRLLKQADLTFAITAEDAQALADNYSVRAETIHVVARGLDLTQYAWLTPDQRLAERRQLGLERAVVIVFAGSQHQPNVAAARLAIAAARELGPAFQVIIAGSVAGQFTAETATPARLAPGDPEQYLRVADMGVNPMLSGSGMNIKMLQYLAWGLPVVSTAVGVRGIHGVDQVHYALAEPAALAPEIRNLAAAPDKLARLRQAGRALVEQHYSAETTARQMIELIEAWRVEHSGRDAQQGRQ